ncbi:hypothetical protein BWQ96_10409 [Gracilariopsis chorda]|uniref:Uncharacterized protein n=1 Tax=Gracilariopsis chorda TaxID=448386 RepID=A0A2V3IBR7_9FLOR|nr:hypothetical protein BWQ96_10757 [Gracilariopsis chorda]PXF39878.1 hypothetical protein BWQ96_10409 [Gracilariopsis chorda]|eukprot:PXF39544.1 hypothetical protein BWQ96_10757 [Gracilariopsis chorda]
MTSQKRDNPLLEMLPASENEAQHPIGQPVTTAVRLEEKAAMSPFKSNVEAATEQQKLGQETGSEKIQHVRSKNPYVLEGSSSSSHYSSEARSPPKLAKSMKDAEETVHEYSSQGKDFDNTRNPSIQRRVLHAPRNLLENDSNDTPTIEGSAMETLTNELHAPTDVANPIEQMRNLERKLEKLMQTMGIQQTAVMPTTSSIVSRESKPVPIPTDWDYESTYYGQCDEYVWRNPPPRNLGSGMNGYGNRWTNLRGGGYHYANHGTDGGFYIRNSDGSSYHFSPSRGGSFRPA